MTINVEMCVKIAENQLFKMLDVALSVAENAEGKKSRWDLNESVKTGVSAYRFHKRVAEAIGFDIPEYEERFDSITKKYPDLVKETIESESIDELKASIKRVYGVQL